MKMRTIVMMLFFTLIILSGCATSDGNNEETDTNQREETNVSQQNEEKESVMSDLGIYIGQADPNTIEIETRDGPKAFQLTEKTMSQIEDLNENDEVKFTYTANEHDQLVLQSIEQTNSNEYRNSTENEEKTVIQSTGTYIGQADPHTIEIETNEGPTAFQLSNEARQDVEQLTEGSHVTFTYYEEGEQRIIDSIEQTN